MKLLKCTGLSILLLMLFVCFAGCNQTDLSSPDSEKSSQIDSAEKASSEETFVFSETLVDHHKVEWNEDALEAKEYLKMDAFRLCRNIEDYKTYKGLVTALLPGTKDGDFPEIPEEWFDKYDLGTLFLSARDSDGTQSFREAMLREFYVNEEGHALALLTLQGVGEYRDPIEEVPSLFASFLMPIEKGMGDRIVSLEYRCAYKDYSEDWDNNSIEQEKVKLDTKAKEIDSWRSVMDIAIMAQSDNQERFDPEKNVFRFDLEKGLLYDEGYAETPILVRLQLAPAEGLHPRGIEDIRSAEAWNARENAEAAEFLAGYGIKEIYNPQETSGDEILKEEKGKILLGAEEWEKTTPRNVWYIKTTPKELSKIVKDPRVIRIAA